MIFAMGNRTVGVGTAHADVKSPMLILAGSVLGDFFFRNFAIVIEAIDDNGN